MGTQQTSFINVGGQPLEIQSFVFVEFDGIAKAPIFGSTTNIGNTFFCGNDGDVSISNSLIDGETLSLSSSMSAGKRACAGNGINAKITLPTGILSGSCSVDAKESNDGRSTSSCNVESFSLGAVQVPECARGKNNINANFYNGNCLNSKTESFEIILDKETEVEVETFNSIGNTGSSSSKITLNFIPLPVEVVEGLK